MYQVISSGKFIRLSDAVDFYHELMKNNANGAGYHVVGLYDGKKPMARWDASEDMSRIDSE